MNLYFILLLLNLNYDGNLLIRESYIDQYKELAIIEMKRAQIPASIKLSQAILESQSGQSGFSKKSNNHFGIKCKSYWKGKTFFHKDDDKNAGGVLIESCFRSYNNVIESYVDHSNFLMRSSHYKHLFKISRIDYKSWAYGLQSAGYATDPEYANKLVLIIEKHGLYVYDQM